MTETSGFAQRLKNGMMAIGFEPRPSILEREFNLRYWGRPVTFQGVRRWLRGESMPEQDKLVVLAEWLRVSPHYLRFGVDDANASVQEKPGDWRQTLSPDLQHVIDAFLSLPAEEKRLVADLLSALSRRSN